MAKNWTLAAIVGFAGQVFLPPVRTLAEGPSGQPAPRQKIVRAGEPTNPQMVDLARAWPGAERMGSLARPRAEAFLKKHATTAGDIVEFLGKDRSRLKYSFQGRLWELALLGGGGRECRAYARIALGDWTSNWTRPVPSVPSPELTRALLPYYSPRKELWYRGPGLVAGVRLIAAAPVPEAVPWLRYCARTRGITCERDAIAGLGLLRTPEGLKALEELWSTMNPSLSDHGTMCSLAHAIAMYGDDGVDAFARVHKVRPRFCYEAIGLAEIGTTKAIRYAESVAEIKDRNDCANLLRVKLSADLPATRLAAALKALDGSDDWLKEIVLDRWRGPAPPELLARVQRMMLSAGDAGEHSTRTESGRRALIALARWQRLASPPQIAWAGPVNGLAVGIELPVFRHGSALQIYFRLHIKPAGRKPLLFLADSSPPLDNIYFDCPIGPGRPMTLDEEAVLQCRITVSPPAAPPHEPVPLRLKLIGRTEAYPDLVGWTGEVAPPDVLTTWQPADEREVELAKWRAFLDGVARNGEVSGGRIGWSIRTIRPALQGQGDWFFIKGRTVDGGGLWLAIPADLRVLTAEEVRRIAKFLAENDRFAKGTVQTHTPRPPSSPPPDARIVLESSDSRTTRYGQSFTPDTAFGMKKIESDLLRSRIPEAIKRLAGSTSEPEQP